VLQRSCAALALLFLLGGLAVPLGPPLRSQDEGVSRRGGVYDLNTNLTGTLVIPLSAVKATPSTSSK
jgi:hypothetical protein